MTCPACSHSNPPDYAFCGNCGTSRPQIDSQVRGRAPAPEQRTIDLTRARATSKVISDTTRYLCAAVHLDSKLATRLVEDVLDEQHRALGPSSGVDVATVLRHALSARRRHLLRDGVLVVISLVVVLGALSTGSAWLFFLLGVLLIWVVVGLEIYVARYLVLAQTLQRRSFRSEKAPAPRDATTERRLAQLGRADDGNVTVYSGFSPFVGGGLARDGWSFAVDVSRPKDEGSRPTAFSITELHGHVRRALDGIDLDGLEVQDRLFVNGQDIRDDSRFLPSPTARPVTAVPDDVVRECLEHPDNLVRHYLWVRMSGWRGELVLNLYLRLALVSQHLFVEASYALLVPLQEECYEVDRLSPEPSPSQLVRLVGRALRTCPQQALIAYPNLAHAVLRPISLMRRSSADRRAIASDLAFDYGATTTVRQAAAGTLYRRYFQRLDVDMYNKIAEKRVFSAITDFLDEHGIDTGELVQRQTMILNNGVMLSGGSSVNSGSLAVGEGAKVTLRTRLTPQRSAPPVVPTGTGAP